MRLRKITENSETEDDNKVKNLEKSFDVNAVLNVNKLICSWNDSLKELLEIENIVIRAGVNLFYKRLQ